MADRTNQAGERPTRNGARITVDQILAAVEADQCIGFCVACGEEHFGVEPDARNYPCDACGMRKVFGAEDLLLRLA